MEKTENILIVEPMLTCKLVYEQHKENGHDCWGNLDWYTTNHVTIDGKTEYVSSSMFVVHDGKKAVELIYEWQFERKGVSYQEKATNFNYGWTPSTEKDYCNPKGGFEYRMVIMKNERIEITGYKHPLPTDQIIEVEKEAKPEGENKPFVMYGSNPGKECILVIHDDDWMHLQRMGEFRNICQYGSLSTEITFNGEKWGKIEPLQQEIKTLRQQLEQYQNKENKLTQ